MFRRGLFLLATWAAGAGAYAQNTTVQVAGSDLLQSAVGEPLMRYVRQNNLDVKVDLYGTLPALVQMREKKVQLALVAVPASQRPVVPEGCEAVPFCFQVAYILVNEDNPATEIDRSELVGVFGAGEEADINYWNKLKQSGALGTMQIAAVTTSADDGVVLELFKTTILGRTPLKGTVRVLGTPSDLLKFVRDNLNALAVSGVAPESGAKTLLVSVPRTGGGESSGSASGVSRAAYSPSEENIYEGDYPMRLPFYLVFRTEDKPRLRELLRLLLGDEMAKSLRAQNLVPLPETIRKRTQLQLDSAK